MVGDVCFVWHGVHAQGRATNQIQTGSQLYVCGQSRVHD